MKILKWLILGIIIIGIINSVSFVAKSNFARYIRQNEKILGMVYIIDDNAAYPLKGIMLFRYNPGNRNYILCSMSPDTRLPYDGNLWRTRILFSKTGNRKESCEVLLKIYEEKFGLNIPHCMYLNYEKLKNIIHDLDGIEFGGRRVFTGEEIDELWAMIIDGAGNHEETSLRNDTRLLKSILIKLYNTSPKKRVMFFLRQIKNTHAFLSWMDTAALFAEQKYFDENNIIPIHITADQDAQTVNMDSYIKELFENVNTGRAKKIISVEVLNASSKSGMALAVTSTLREAGVDVQNWGNYDIIQPVTMVIDRLGNWNNAKAVADILHCKEVYTETDSSRFVDVSIILGEDIGNN
ncbi:MAG: LytR C-terminal domain-containing protein [Elusimicrobiota bacterium]